MSGGQVFILLLIATLVNFGISSEFNRIANEKGYEGSKYGWWCFFTSIVGYIMVAALPDRRRPEYAPSSAPVESDDPAEENEDLPEL